MYGLLSQRQRLLDLDGEGSNLNLMESPIASSKKEVDTVIGKVLVAKRTFQENSAKLGGAYWSVKAGTFVYALTEGTRTDNTWYRPENRKVAKFIFNGVSGTIDLDNSFDTNWAIIEPGDALKEKIFVFTGALSNTREYFKTLVECFGGIFGSSVTAKTNYLVMGDSTYQGDVNYQSSKAKKAKSLGVPVINETGFYKLLKG